MVLKLVLIILFSCFSIAIADVNISVKKKGIVTNSEKKNTSAFLGIICLPLDSIFREHLSIPEDRGVMVYKVKKASPADRVGISKGDIVLKLNETFIKSKQQLSKILKSKSPGEKIKLEYLSKGSHKSKEILLSERVKTQPRSSFEFDIHSPSKILLLSSNNHLPFKDLVGPDDQKFIMQQIQLSFDGLMKDLKAKNGTSVFISPEDFKSDFKIFINGNIIYENSSGNAQLEKVFSLPALKHFQDELRAHIHKNTKKEEKN